MPTKLEREHLQSGDHLEVAEVQRCYSVPLLDRRSADQQGA